MKPNEHQLMLKMAEDASRSALALIREKEAELVRLRALFSEASHHWSWGDIDYMGPET